MLDNRILEQLFRRNYSEMIRLARVLLGDDGEAEDVIQDIFLRVADQHPVALLIKLSHDHPRLRPLRQILPDAIKKCA